MKKLVLFMLIVCTFFIVFGCVSTKGKVIPPGTVILQDFEEEHYWISVGDFWKDGDGSLTAANSTKNVTYGKTSLEGTFKFKDVINTENKNENARFKTKEATFYNDVPAIYDWSPYKKLLLDVTNATDTEIEIALAICTGDDWLWIQSDVLPLKPGLNEDLTYDLTANTYKSALTGWENTGTLENIHDVKRVILRLLGPVDFEGTIYIDCIRLAE